MTGNLSAQGDGAAGFTLPGFRFLPPPHPPSMDLVPLKPEEHAIKFEVSGGDRGWGQWRVKAAACPKEMGAMASPHDCLCSTLGWALWLIVWM